LDYFQFHPYSHLREIVDCKRGISADTALRLECFFGGEAQGLLNLQSAREFRLAEKNNAKIIKKEVLC
jgi:antitoxin HigA-1